MKAELLKRLEEIENSIEKELEKIDNPSDLSKKRIFYLGRKGEIKKITEKISLLSEIDRKEVGSKLNFVREKIEKLLAEKESLLISKNYF